MRENSPDERNSALRSNNENEVKNLQIKQYYYGYIINLVPRHYKRHVELFLVTDFFPLTSNETSYLTIF